MKKKSITALIVLIFIVITPCTTFAVTRQEVEQIMHSLLPSSKGITTEPLSASPAAAYSEPILQDSTLEQEQLKNDPYSYGAPTIPQQQSTKQNNPVQVKPQNKNDIEARNLTRQEVFLTCMNKMGWTYTLLIMKRLAKLPEFAKFSPIEAVCNSMEPTPPVDLFAPAGDIFPNSDLARLKDWLRKCVNKVSLETSFTLHGNTLSIIKSGVPTPSGKVQDMKARNVPLFIVYYSYDPSKNTAQVTQAQQYGSDKLPLATIAKGTQGAEFAINGGYFGAAKGLIIGVLRSNGKTVRQNFWPHRSGFAWNNLGEHIFFDAKTMQHKTLVNNPTFDRFTDIFQAGPMLIFNGQVSQNSEDLAAGNLSQRHPRTFVAEQPDGTIVWGIVDGRSASHSVGMTIKELRNFCIKHNFVNALNLDGGGSSSAWWKGITCTRPCNKFASERRIPYAIVVYNPEIAPQQLNSPNTPGSNTIAIPKANTITIPRTDDYSVDKVITVPRNTTQTAQPQKPQTEQKPQNKPNTISIPKQDNSRNNNLIVIPKDETNTAH